MTQNAKGPAEAATSPSHGSTHPARDKEMNTTTDSTAAAAPPVPKDLWDLETPIYAATRFASILANLLEENLGKDLSSIVGPKGTSRYHVTADDVDNIYFSIYRLQEELRVVQSTFEEAIR